MVHGAFYVLYTLTAHKPAHGHGYDHCHAHRDPDFSPATEVTQGPLLSVHYTHIKRTPNSRCVFRIGLADANITKMTAHSRATGLPDLAGDLTDPLLGCLFSLMLKKTNKKKTTLSRKKKSCVRNFLVLKNIKHMAMLLTTATAMVVVAVVMIMNSGSASGSVSGSAGQYR
jgi:hypothetical protein